MAEPTKVVVAFDGTTYVAPQVSVVFTGVKGGDEKQTIPVDVTLTKKGQVKCAWW